MSSPNISFSTIPASIRKPGVYTEINTSLAVRGVPANAQKAVVIAQKTISGTTASQTLQQVFSDADAALYAGTGSVVHRMVKALLVANPNLARVDYVGIDDPAGAAAAQALVMVTGTAAAAGTADLYVDNHHISWSVASADTAATTIGGLASGIAAASGDLAVTAIVTGSNGLLLVARNKGVAGNYIPVSYVFAGATGQVSTATGMSGGSGDINIGSATTGALAAIAAAGHDVIAVQGVDPTMVAALKTYLDWVSSSTEQRPAVAVLGYNDLCTGAYYSAVKTLGGTTANHGRIAVGYLPGPTTVGMEASAPYIAGALAGVVASQEDPAQPYDSVVVPGLPPSNYQDRLTRTQQEDLLQNGVTPLIVDSGENVAICRLISTYVTNASGIVDPALLDLTTIRTLDYVRLATRQRLALRFPNSKLSARSPVLVRAEVLDVLYQLDQLEILENVKENEAGVIVERDTQDPNRIDVRIPAYVVPGLHVIAERIDLLF